MGAGGRAGLTVVGQVVGSYFGPIGSAIGGMLGAALGNALWPEQIEGPKLGEFQMMTSTYGAAIPDIWGGMRVGGNVFWCSPIREVEVTEQQGKGGGPEVTYKKRFADIAIGLCAGEIVGVRKLWINQKLEFDLGDAADIGTIYASFQRGGEGMRFYSGSQTQLPDPTIESYKGVGQTPAYRGLAYMVLENFELGTTFPNITAEVIKGGTTLGPRELFNTDWELPYAGSSGDHIKVRIAGAGAELLARAEDGRAFVSGVEGQDSRVISGSAVAPWPPNANADFAAPWESTLLLWPEDGNPIYANRLPLANDATGRAQLNVVQGDSDLSATFMDGDNWVSALIPSADRQHVLALMIEAGGGTSYPTYWVLWRYESGAFSEARRGTCEPTFIAYRSAGAMSSATGGVQVWYAGMMESDLEHVWQVGSGGLHEVFLHEIGSDGVLRLIEAFPTTVASAGTVAILSDGSVAWAELLGNLYGFTRAPALTIDLSLAQLVSDLCEQCGLTVDQIDVTDLAGIDVNGYLRKSVMTGRAALEPLMVAYGFDAVESDDTIKFVMRAGTSAVTIPQDDLGAGQGQAAEALVETTRTQESELPMQLTVSYIAPHADYQVGTQTVTRGTTESNEKQQIQLPLALSDQEAIEVAYRMQYEVWTARNQRAWATTVKYAAYEPTDVIDLEVA